MMAVKHLFGHGFLAAIISISGAAAAAAQNSSAQGPSPAGEASNSSELAKKTQNPVGDIVSVPLQFNWNGGGGYKDQTFFNLNIQPVIPIHITPAITLISRTIFPIDNVPVGNGVSYSGMGDIEEETFFTPAHPGKIIWGVGPAFSFPTATAYPVKTGTWAGGVSAVLLATPGSFVLGSLFTQVSPLTDTGGAPKANNFLWQYFINYNFGKGWALSTAPSITANWDAPSGQQWTVPVGGGIARTLVFNKQPMTLTFQYYFNAKHPDNANATTLRFAVTFIFPEKGTH